MNIGVIRDSGTYWLRTGDHKACIMFAKIQNLKIKIRIYIGYRALTLFRVYRLSTIYQGLILN